MGRATASGEPSSNKREAVLAAAVRCFAAHGLAGAGMRDIARAAGLTEGTLYHYFPSKDALIAEAFRWSAFQASDVRRAMQRRGVPLRERLLGVGEEFLAALRRNPDWTRVVIREALRAAPETRPRTRCGRALISLATERTRALARRAARRDARGPDRAAAIRGGWRSTCFHALIGHFVAEAIAGSRPARRAGADPFLVHLVDTIAGQLERGRAMSAARRALSRHGARRWRRPSRSRSSRASSGAARATTRGPDPRDPIFAENFDLVGYHDLDGRPAFKLALQVVADRWYLYTAHFWDRGWSVLDVTEPSQPELLAFLPGPANTATLQIQVADGLMLTSLEKPPDGAAAARPVAGSRLAAARLPAPRSRVRALALLAGRACWSGTCRTPRGRRGSAPGNPAGRAPTATSTRAGATPTWPRTSAASADTSM